MGNIFAGSEIVELGIQIERNGYDFYAALSAQTGNDSAKKIYDYLSGEEKKHIAVFEKILEKAGKYEPQGLDAGQYYEYMNALAAGCVFTQKNKGSQIAARITSDLEAVDLGIAFEKDSIIFYEGIKKIVPQFDHQIVAQLIAQEQAHLTQLSSLKKEFSK
jgi:rubrerythrin